MSTRDEDFGFLKDDSQDIRKGPLSVEANLMFPSAGLMFPKSTNGQHENGALEADDDDEDDDDLGPETNVDTVDDASDYVPANIVINRDLFQQKLERENGQDDMIQINDVLNETQAPEDESKSLVFLHPHSLCNFLFSDNKTFLTITTSIYDWEKKSEAEKKEE